MTDFDFGGIDQEAFLDNLRRKMPRTDANEPHPGSSAWPGDHESRFGYGEKADMFARALEGLGGKVIRVKDRRAAWDAAAALLKERGARRAVVGSGDFTGFEERLSEAGIEIDRFSDLSFAHGSADRALDRVNAWDAGVDWADYAVADLGAVALLTSERGGRSVSLLPPLYISLVAKDALFVSRRTVLEDVSRRFKTEGVRSALTFVTGPSRSADIEMDLSIGVHGPGEVVAILIAQA